MPTLHNACAAVLTISLVPCRIEMYWQAIPLSSRFKLSKFELLVEDVRLLLNRFSYQESFSEHAKGGGKESNIKLIPFMLQMGVQLFRESTSATVRSKIIRGLSSLLIDSSSEHSRSQVWNRFLLIIIIVICVCSMVISWLIKQSPIVFRT